MERIDSITYIVGEDTAPDAIRNLARPSKEATSSCRFKGETMILYIERSLLPSQSHLSLENTSWKSAESQNLSMVLLSNTNLFSQLYSLVMSNLIAKIKHKPDSSVIHVPIGV